MKWAIKTSLLVIVTYFFFLAPTAVFFDMSIGEVAGLLALSVLLADVFDDA